MKSMLQREILLSNLEETERFGLRLGEVAKAGDVICLNGDLGAGKTTLTQAIARGLQVPPSFYVTSPSFAMFHEYPGRLPLYHMDFYKLEDAGEIIDLGFEEYFYLEGLTVIEWSERAVEILPADRLSLYLQIQSESSRKVKLQYFRSWQERVDQL